MKTLEQTKRISDRTVKVLIVDDEKSWRDIFGGLLSDVPCEKDFSEDGAHALESIEANTYDIILTDLKVPGADGIEILKTARKVNPNVLVIIITGYSSLEHAVMAVREGAYSYITKPFMLAEIELIIRNAYNKICLINENMNLRQMIKDLEAIEEHGKKGCKEEDFRPRLSEIEEHNLFSCENDESIFTTVSSMKPVYFKQRRRNDKGWVLDELKKLGMLKKEGIITDEEFHMCKKKILEKI